MKQYTLVLMEDNGKDFVTVNEQIIPLPLWVNNAFKQPYVGDWEFISKEQKLYQTDFPDCVYYIMENT